MTLANNHEFGANPFLVILQKGTQAQINTFIAALYETEAEDPVKQYPYP